MNQGTFNFVESQVGRARTHVDNAVRALRRLEGISLESVESDVEDLVAMLNDASEQAQHIIDTLYDVMPDDEPDGNFDDFDKLS
jgi:hypothetical protein